MNEFVEHQSPAEEIEKAKVLGDDFPIVRWDPDLMCPRLWTHLSGLVRMVKALSGRFVGGGELRMVSESRMMFVDKLPHVFFGGDDPLRVGTVSKL